MQTLSSSSVENSHPVLRIAVLDSGAGGLSIVKAIKEQIHPIDIVYLADHKHFPYGLMDDETLIKRCVILVERLTKEHTLDAIVIACNTASTLALNTLRERFQLPFIGVVPAIKPAALQTHSDVIGVLATPATIKRHYLKDLIANFAVGKHIILMGSEILVQQAEKWINDGQYSQDNIEREIEHLFHQNTDYNLNIKSKMDTVVLACTHFPLIDNAIRKGFLKLGLDVISIDSGKAIAKRIAELFSETLKENTINPTQEKSTTLIISTGQCNLEAYQNFFEELATSNQSGKPQTIQQMKIDM